MNLILTPIIAALGYDIAKMSGRGLSFIVWTINKLESINAKTDFDLNYAQELMNKYRMFVMSQTDQIDRTTLSFGFNEDTEKVGQN